jgi:hypothetical protein
MQPIEITNGLNPISRSFFFKHFPEQAQLLKIDGYLGRLVELTEQEG